MMAKNFFFFKFIPTEWMTGDIVYEDFDVQGLFINICSLYWQRDGILSVEDINKRYKRTDLTDKLIGRFITVNEGFISIKFLDEQLIEADHICKKNSDNGKMGGRPKKANQKPKKAPGFKNKPNHNPTESQLKAKKSKIEVEVELHTELEQEKESDKEVEGTTDIVNCLDIALKDSRWIKASKATKELLEDFNKVLEERGIYKKLPIDYKTHFVNWKKKLPVPSKNKETFSREENQW